MHFTNNILQLTTEGKAKNEVLFSSKNKWYNVNPVVDSGKGEISDKQTSCFLIKIWFSL